MVEAKHTPRQWLETAVQPDLAEELLKHRQRLRKPLTDFAAKLLEQVSASQPQAFAASFYAPVVEPECVPVFRVNRCENNQPVEW